MITPNCSVRLAESLFEGARREQRVLLDNFAMFPREPLR